MRPRLYADYLQDILDSCVKVQRFIASISVEDFVKDDEKVYAVMLALEIIGEAAKHIPPSERQRYSQLPWREIVGMRDKIAHQYFGVNRRLLWQTAQSDVPPLQATMTWMIADLEARQD